MRVFIIVTVLLSLFFLNGCGIVQIVYEGTASVAKAIFVWDIRTLHLDFTARAELNTDDDGKSSPVVIRIYQLKDSNSFDSALYPELINADKDLLGGALLALKEIVLKPNTALSLDIPFDKNADYVGIVGLFKEPDLNMNNWKIVLKRSDLHINSARLVTVNPFSFELVSED